MSASPTLDVPGTRSVAETGTLVVRRTDADYVDIWDDGAALTVTVAVPEGSGLLWLGGTAGLDGFTAYPAASISLSGSVEAVNAALDGLSFKPSGPGDVDVTVQVSDGENPVEERVFRVAVQDVASAPEILSGALTAAEEQTLVGPILVQDGDTPASGLAFEIAGGPDAALFRIVDGVLSFAAKPDFEAPGAADGSNTYRLTVSVNDGTTATTRDLTVAVAPVAEAPVMAASAAFAVDENGTAVAALSASDPDGTPVAFAIAGGADAARFAVDPATGALSFKTAPDFETPGDADGDNVYAVEVSATDAGGLSARQAVSVAVQNANDAPVFGQARLLHRLETWTAVAEMTAADQDAGDVVRYEITGGADAARFTLNPLNNWLLFKAAPDYENPDDSGSDRVYEVEITASDANGGATTAAFSVEVGDGNEALTGIVLSNVAAPVAENGGRVKVADIGFVDDAVTVPLLSLAGSDAASFEIRSLLGKHELLFVGGANYEAKSEYSVTIQAKDQFVIDGPAPLATLPFTLAISDVNEAPALTSMLFQPPAGTEDVPYLLSRADLVQGYGDVDGDALDAAGLVASHGVLQATATGWTLTPPADYNGEVTISYSVVDGRGGSVAASRPLTFAAVNDAPRSLRLLGAKVAENSSSSVPFGLLESTDIDSAAFTYEAVDDAGGRFGITQAGAVFVRSGALLDHEQAASHTIQVRTSDSGGASSVFALTIAVEDVADETVSGGDAPEVFLGGSGVDALFGGGGGDRLEGRGGNDTLDGGSGPDTMLGGAGNDAYHVDQAGDVVTELPGEGVDTVRSTLTYTLGAGVEALILGGAAALNGFGNGLANTLTGNGAANVLFGHAGNDALNGEAGNDWLDGGADQDRLFGGDGADTLIGAAGLDTLDGGVGNDALYGGAENDALFGQGGNDLLEAGSGTADQAYGGEGADTLLGGSGADWLDGGAGADQLYGAEGQNTLLGGAGADWMVGGGSADQLYGGADDDVLQGFAGADWIDAAEGANAAFGGLGADTLLGGSGADWLDGGADADQLYGGAGANVLIGEGGNDWIVGGSGYDQLYGGAGVDMLQGGGQGDWIHTGEGDNTAFGGEGADTVQAGSGDDWLYGGLGGDQLYGGEGQNALFGEDGADWMVGGTAYDQLYGGTGADTLQGGSGDDWIVGGLGADVALGGSGRDTFVANAGELSGDTYGDFQAGADTLQLQGYGAGARLVDNGSGSYTLTHAGGAESFTLTASRSLVLGVDYFLL